jgi:hypothetical protein
MRKRFLIAATMAAALGVAAVAYAATTTATFRASLAPSKAGTLRAPKSGTFLASAQVRNSDGSQPPQVKTIVLALDRNVRTNGAQFKSCSPTLFNNSQNIDDPRCRTAKVGRAKATAQVGTLVLNFDTRLYNGGLNKITVVVKQVGGGVFQAFNAPITRGSSPYGPNINIVVPGGPNSLRNPQPGLYPSLTGLQNVSIGATTQFRRHTVGYLLVSGCTRSSYKLRVVFKFVATPTVPNPGPDITKNGTSACRS